MAVQTFDITILIPWPVHVAFLIPRSLPCSRRRQPDDCVAGHNLHANPKQVSQPELFNGVCDVFVELQISVGARSLVVTEPLLGIGLHHDFSNETLRSVEGGLRLTTWTPLRSL